MCSPMGKLKIMIQKRQKGYPVNNTSNILNCNRVGCRLSPKHEKSASAVTYGTIHQKRLLRGFPGYTNKLSYQLKYRWLDFSEVSCFLATSWSKVFLEAALEVSQQYGEHMTRTPRNQQHLPMILSEALHASAKRVVLE